MSLSLYDISVINYRQILQGVSHILEKGESFCSTNGMDLEAFTRFRLYPNMWPLHFQINSVAHHSLGAIKGIEKGEFNPPPALEDSSYGGLQKLIENTLIELDGLSENSVNQLMGKPVKFKAGDFELPFIAEHFILSFSLPNFHFHATTAYDILRHNGVDIGKMDYLGSMRTS